MGSMSELERVLSLSRLTKRFGYFRVLDDVSMELRAGELLLLLGPNGAGKTTLTRILTTLSRPSGGTLRFGEGKLDEAGRVRLRREVGYLSHQSFLYAHLSARENLAFFGKLYGMADLDRRISALLERVRLSDARDRLVGTYSRGMQQRLSIARVLLTDPRLLILDEPYSGLDPEGSRTLTGLLKGLKDERRAILLVTHELEDCLPIADRVAILCKGRVVFDSAAGGLSQEEVRRRYFAATAGEAAP
jgi:heme exporter protein A